MLDLAAPSPSPCGLVRAGDDMAKRRNPDLEQRVTELEAEVATLKAQLSHAGVSDTELATMRNDVALLRSELAARGLGPVPNPGAKRQKLDPHKVSAIRARNAAYARAKKEVGKGPDHVKTIETKQKLEAQAGIGPSPKTKGKRR